MRIMFFQIQTNLVITIILSIILIHANIRLDKSELMNKLFMLLLGMNIFILILEIISVLVNVKNAVNLRWINLSTNMVGFMAVPLFLMLVILYFECWLQKNLKSVKRCKTCIYIPALILFAFTVINIKAGWIATVDATNQYMRGPLFFLVPLVTLFYLVCGSLRILQYYKKFVLYKYVLINLYIMVLIVVILIQVIGKIYLTTWSTVGSLLICTYIFNIIEELQYDALTALENKQSYIRYITKLAKKPPEILTAINIDLDDFKRINDRFGHQEGDEALKNFTQILRNSFSYKQRIFRMGGDEFLVLSEYQGKKQMVKYLDRFKDRLTAYNATSRKPYTLKFSYGMDSLNDQYKNIDEFLDYIDNMMYIQKQNKKRYLTRN